MATRHSAVIQALEWANAAHRAGDLDGARFVRRAATQLRRAQDNRMLGYLDTAAWQLAEAKVWLARAEEHGVVDRSPRTMVRHAG